MYPNYVDSEEMDMRQNLDLIASLNMIAEGSPVHLLDEQELVQEDNKI
ncbi:hypothetical protein [Bacillus sp. FJAT-22090]|nr:hypothetical protein [Bacillus sp. FJAT-22090]